MSAVYISRCFSAALTLLILQNWNLQNMAVVSWPRVKFNSSSCFHFPSISPCLYPVTSRFHSAYKGYSFSIAARTQLLWFVHAADDSAASPSSCLHISAKTWGDAWNVPQAQSHETTIRPKSHSTLPIQLPWRRRCRLQFTYTVLSATPRFVNVMYNVHEIGLCTVYM